MQALEFYRAITMDRENLLDRVIALLAEHEISYCIIGGQAVNAYVEPLVSLDLDIVVAVDRLEEVGTLLKSTFKVERFTHSLNISAVGSDLRVQFQTDERYGPFIERAEPREVLGTRLNVAQLADVLSGKIWAAMDAARRSSKRRKDLLDIERIVETHPRLRAVVPAELLELLDRFA